ncbi:hypothetical protein Bbelb_183330 [Branchiostoma belcheri]|nr:hypothetical protein Bbelb_183330 [Branchiostoma belcheri]
MNPPSETLTILTKARREGGPDVIFPLTGLRKLDQAGSILAPSPTKEQNPKLSTLSAAELFQPHLPHSYQYVSVEHRGPFTEKFSRLSLVRQLHQTQPKVEKQCTTNPRFWASFPNEEKSKDIRRCPSDRRVNLLAGGGGMKGKCGRHWSHTYCRNRSKALPRFQIWCERKKDLPVAKIARSAEPSRATNGLALSHTSTRRESRI